MTVPRYAIVLLAVTLSAACSGSSGFTTTQSTALPGAGAPSYIGTFPIPYNTFEGTCGSSVMPTSLTVTGTAASTDSDGNAITLLYGHTNGGAVAWTFANLPGPGQANPNLTSSYVINSTGIIYVNLFTGWGPIANSQAEILITTQWQPPAQSLFGTVYFVSGPLQCRESEGGAAIDPPSS